jgi:hypothetical protein
MTYTQGYGNLYAITLTPEGHEKTCGYWFVVRNGTMSHTAFETRAGLDRWLTERGLTLKNDLPEAGTFGTTRIMGEYRTAMHGEFVSDDYRDGTGEGDFYSLPWIAATAKMSNGQYTLALITEEDGIRIVNYLNPNVKTRVVFDYRTMAARMR